MCSKPHHLRHLSPFKFHRFRSNFFQNGGGFALHYTTENCEDGTNETTGGCSTFCGGNYTSTSGMISSPWHPEQYPPARDCIYLVSQPSKTNIQITIKNVDINCDYFGKPIGAGQCLATGITDYLEMRDGHSAESPVMLRYCGNGSHIPTSMQTTQNFLWIRYRAFPIHN